MNTVLLMTGTVTKRGGNLFCDGKYWFKSTDSHPGAFAPDGANESSSFITAVGTGGWARPTPGSYPGSDFATLLNSEEMQLVQLQCRALWMVFPSAGLAYRGIVLVFTSQMVTNVLFGSEMLHYTSMGKFNDNDNLREHARCLPLTQTGLIRVFKAHSSMGHGTDAPQGYSEKEQVDTDTSCSFSNVWFAFTCCCCCTQCAC